MVLNTHLYPQRKSLNQSINWQKRTGDSQSRITYPEALEAKILPPS